MPAAGKQTEHLSEHAAPLRYLLFLPQGYGRSSGKERPLILFLHGMAERGDDLSLVKRHGIPKIVEQRPGFSFIAVSPQCPEDAFWHEHHGALKALLDQITAEHAVDPNRVYLTGNSMGGYGTWSLAIACPEIFAAIAPICGGGSPEMVCALREVPVWAFHGANDQVVDLTQSQQMVEALQACGGNVRFTVYPDAGHDSWTRTYEDPELYEWFLQHERR